MEAGMWYIIGYFAVTLVLITLGAVFEKRVVGDCDGNERERQEKETTYALNIFMGSLMWPINMLMLIGVTLYSIVECLWDMRKD